MIGGMEPPEKIRVSIGTAIVLGLTRGRIDAEPTTAYLLTYREGKCQAACAFCPQSRRSSGRADMLSRVTWPVFSTREAIRRAGEAFHLGKIVRVCIQALNYPSVVDDLTALARLVKEHSDVPISISCQPLSRSDLRRLFDAGVQRVGISLDAATKEIFDRVKGAGVGGPYTWSGHFKALKEAVRVFGEGNVTTHLIAGLGETEEEFVKTIQICVDMGVYPALFAFTPIPGTLLSGNPPPSLASYRKLQLAHYLITKRMSRYRDMKFRNGCLVDFGVSDEQLKAVIRRGEPFMTSGCPGCNRPYYNERPGGPLYNFPRRPTLDEIAKIEKFFMS